MKKILLLSAILLVFAGCKKDKEEDPAPVPQPEAYFISGKLDGQNFTLTKGKNGYTNTQHRSDFPNDPDPTVSSFNSNFSNSKIEDIAVTVELGYLPLSGSKPDETSFNNYFNPGNRDYVGNLGSVLDGALITLYNISGIYGSAHGEQPTSSTFKINSKTIRKIDGKNYVDVRGEFNCSLFDGLGDSRDITNGKFYCRFADEN